MSLPANRDIVEFLERHSALMELDGANAFRVRAFARAAGVFGELEEDGAAMAAAGTLTSLEGVGKGVAELVTEFVDTGTAGAHRALLERVPVTLLDLLSLSGLGLKKVKALHGATGIATLAELEAACRSGALDKVAGFGAKTQKNLLRGIDLARRSAGHLRVHRAMATATELVAALEQNPHCLHVCIAGSLRRRCEVVGNLDLVAVTEAPAEVSATLVGHRDVYEVLSQGEATTSVRLRSGIRVDLHTASQDRFPTVLHHVTGSRDHHESLNAHARSRGLRLSAEGLFRGDVRLPCRDEAELFQALGLACIPPEMREGLGEVEAAGDDRLPPLVEMGDLRGILHAHSTYSDGLEPLAVMAEAVRHRGFQYLGISDHSKTAGYASGLVEEAVDRQHEEIDTLNAGYGDSFRIFKGIESDILRDGRLDYDEEYLARFDFVIVSIHLALNMSASQMTARVIKALEHPSSTILAHPSGRLLLEREEYPMDMDQIMAAAAANHVALEINAHPHRLDLDWRHLRRARELGARFAINPDAHRISDLDYLEWGVGVARKGWLRTEDVITSLDMAQMASHFLTR